MAEIEIMDGLIASAQEFEYERSSESPTVTGKIIGFRDHKKTYTIEYTDLKSGKKIHDHVLPSQIKVKKDEKGNIVRLVKERHNPV